jgi:hypothetical protein
MRPIAIFSWEDPLPPLITVTPFNCLVTRIHHHENAELKLKGIISSEATVKHFHGMVHGDLLHYYVGHSNDPRHGDLPSLLPVIAIPGDIGGPHPPPTRHSSSS